MNRRRYSSFERETRRDLAQLVVFLRNVALDASRDDDLRLCERELFRRQRRIFSAAITKLVKMHLNNHSEANALARLFEALGAAAFIASRSIMDPIENRRRSAFATKERLKQGNELRLVIEAVAARRYKPAYPPKSRAAFAKQILVEVNDELRAKGKPEVSWTGIEKHLRKDDLRFPRRK